MQNKTSGTVPEKNHRVQLISVFTGVLLLSFILKFFFHELWKDEWQAWLLATKTESWSHLTSHLSGEGHPALWFFVLRAWHTLVNWTGLTDEIQLQVVHFLLSATALYVLFFRIKSPLWLKTTIAMGYFFFFEYGMLDRGYILVVLFSLCSVVCLQQPSTNRQMFLLSGLLFLLTQTEVYGTILAFSFLVFYVIEFKTQTVKFKKTLIPALAWMAGTFLFYVQVAPANTGTTDYAAFSSAETENARIVLQTFQSLTANTFYPGLFTTIYAAPVNAAALITGALLVLAIAYMFYDRKALLISFMVCFLGMFFFTAWFYTGGPRHWGNLVVFFCCALFLFAAKHTFKPATWVIAGSVLFVQVLHNIRAMADEFRYPFTNAKAAGNYIQNNIPPTVPVLGMNKFFSVPVIGYSQRPFNSFPNGETYYYFESADWQQKIYLPGARDLFLFKQYTHAPYIVIIYNHPLPAEQFPGIIQLAVFDGMNVRGENYYIYKY